MHVFKSMLAIVHLQALRYLVIKFWIELSPLYSMAYSVQCQLSNSTCTCLHTSVQELHRNLVSAKAEHEQHFLFCTALPVHLSNTSANTYQLPIYIFLLRIIDQQQDSKFLAWKKFNTTMPPAPFCYTSTWHYTRAELDEYNHDSCKTACHAVIKTVQTLNDETSRELI